MSFDEQQKTIGNSNLEHKTPADAEAPVCPENIPKPSTPKTKVHDFDSDGVSLIEDNFAFYYDENGTEHHIKRFTWKNKNKIQVQVINYGARVLSLKLPDRQGEIEDVLLGFDDLAGYLFYDKFYFGSVIGRASNVVKNSSFTIDNKIFKVSSNFGKHSMHGGYKGFDKAVWNAYITGKKVIMSYISPHLSEGYPGDLFVRVAFELSAKNEFKIDFEAQTTRPTCVDLSHLLYFNLAGHHTGPDEIYRHILTLNCNCFTPQVNKIPTGEILNVMHTPFDFQIPKILGKVIGIVPKDGFDQNLCVNRGMYQHECFVGRILHPPSGRMLEIYSTQPGVQLNTANHFGYGNILSIDDIMQRRSKTKCDTGGIEKLDKTILLSQRVHNKVQHLLKLDGAQHFEEIQGLIQKLSDFRMKSYNESIVKLVEQPFDVTPLQHEYLKKAREIVCENDETDEDCLDLKEALSTILKLAKIVHPPLLASDGTADLQEIPRVSAKRSSLENRSSAKVGLSSSNEARKSGLLKVVSSPRGKTEGNSNIIPIYYRNSDQIRGKGQAVYRTHGAIALQTQNYPNAVNMKQFPNPILYPGEVYKHETVYRFWIRAGNPNRWIRRNINESKKWSNNNKS